MDYFIWAGSLGTVGVGEQQNFGAFSLPVGMFVRAGNNFDLLALLLGERDMVFLGGHDGIPPHRMRKAYLIVIPVSYLEKLIVHRGVNPQRVTP
jgi:hypothetical protein